jgi:hypothetical protein
MTTWRVSWKESRYDYKQLIEDFRTNRHTGFIKQSKGMAKMRVIPQINDDVYISCNKKKIMRCKVVSNFVENQQEMRDDYHKGPTSTHAHTQNNTFLMLHIIDTYTDPEADFLQGNQRTWTRLH